MYSPVQVPKDHESIRDQTELNWKAQVRAAPWDIPEVQQEPYWEEVVEWVEVPYHTEPVASFHKDQVPCFPTWMHTDSKVLLKGPWHECWPPWEELQLVQEAFP